MKKAWVFTLLAGAAVLSLPLSASAEMVTKDVVKDARGGVVVNTWGNCVLTKWDGAMSECGSAIVDNELLQVYFEFDSAELTPAAMAKLDSLAGILTGAEGVESIDVVGYADKIGGNSYNQRLSQRRADAVSAYLASKGYLNTRSVMVQALGEGSPVSDCGGVNGEELKACLWRDRRVEIKLNYKQ